MRAMAATIAAAVIGTVPVLAQSPASKRLGVASCAQSFCHGSARPLTATQVLQNEYVTWSSFDPHSRAFDTLRSRASAEMARRLGLGNPSEAKACLDCHADNHSPQLRGAKFHLDDGVGCEACHGSAERWIADHHRQAIAPRSAMIERGLQRLDDPAVRAKVCTGCHVGDRDRFVTHAMMAAGHPRLSFELDTFTEIWRVSGGREHFRRDADYSRRKTVATASAVWLAGLLEAARLRVGMVDAHSRPVAGGLPEFGVYNCFSCHRSMRVPNWPEAADDELPPGSLRYDDSALRMLSAALAGLGSQVAPRLVVARRAWQQSLADPKKAPAANRELLRWLTAAEREIATMRLGAASARAMLDALARSAQRGEYADYIAAEQAAMGMALLVDEAGLQSRLDADVDRLFRALADDSRFDRARFREAFRLRQIDPNP